MTELAGLSRPLSRRQLLRAASLAPLAALLLAAFAVDPPRVHAGGPVSDRPAGGPDEMSAFVPLSRVQREAWRSRVQQLQRSYREGMRRA